MSWPDFVVGLRHRSREVERQKLRLAAAIRVGTNADKDGFRKWYDEIERAVNG